MVAPQDAVELPVKDFWKPFWPILNSDVIDFRRCMSLKTANFTRLR